ncbi:MAG: hypothetical protein IJ935_03270 [Afipia sp.]|nr:hypothetical protein [Afipia sp.]
MSINKAFDTDRARAAQERRFGRAGDAIRQGRAAPIPDDLAFVEEGGQVNARLGVVTVGAIYINPTGARHAFMWRCFLPMTPAMQPALDLDAAKRALSFKVREWCDGAGLVISAAAMAKLRSKR